ncbi:hypothetical protein I6N90_00435 [Paenibacillus sp. GSMTC-2017]|uniref:hypothetical protein n=1 Tax=Paenibacillus sp. GSMTC-2017 TaxID=2794350 RepID=UPI0018D96E59|nr:hypothetical protein [Paenibacillus sp. GSMTC-2017]MBH5316273.1 hypothetical protein [Paenibacillus sp. GSMTC-2017]
MATVNVVSVFTRGARSSDTAELRLARVANDISRANQVWSTGFFPGVSCNINFVSSQIIFRDDVTLVANTVPSIEDPRVVNLISQTKAATNNLIAIYVVYVSGPTLSSGAIGNAGPQFDNFINTTNFRLVGNCVISDDAIDTFLLAHEVGHVLFGRFLNNNSDSFTINDPSNPGNGHNDNPQNVMFPFIPASNPFINAAQCNVASQSRVIIENAGANPVMATADANAFSSIVGNGSSSSSEKGDSCCQCCDHGEHDGCFICIPIPKEVKKLNKHVFKLLKKIGPDKLNTKFNYICKDKQIVVKIK